MFFADAVFIPNDQGELISLVSPIAEATAPLPPTDIAATLMKMLICMAALAALIFATYWFLKKLIQNRLQKGVGDPAMSILEKRMLSSKTMLYLIEVEGKKILCAESHLEIKALGSFPAEGSTEEIYDSDPAAPEN